MSREAAVAERRGVRVTVFYPNCMCWAKRLGRVGSEAGPRKSMRGLILFGGKIFKDFCERHYGS